MRSTKSPSLFVALASVVLLTGTACSPAATPSGSSGSGGRAGGSGGTGGTSSSGTGGTTSSGTGGSSSSGTGGSSANGGSSGSAGGTGGSRTGGSSGGGTGGSSGQGDAGAPDHAGDTGSAPDSLPMVPGARPPKPSAGCGKMNPMQGARTIMTGGMTAMFNVRLPTGYDANKPMPLGLGFHGFGNGACGPDSGECRGFAMLPAVTVYMKSIGQGWEQSAVLNQNIQYFQDVVALMKNEFCIDENRIFVAGVSSGGQFVEHLTCRFGDWLWQVSPVCASVVGAANMNCKGTPPILVIHGVTDQAGNYGVGVAEMFARRNGCSMTQPAGLAKARADMMAAFQAGQAQHVCVDWEGCTANPVRFCISSQITYNGLTHGWPRVGGMLIGDFLGMLK
ncbi:MAG TPA: acyl-CoA thioester hydrolase/BAAT C-terminal domain-containing protein [Polyangia bacterium]